MSAPPPDDRPDVALLLHGLAADGATVATAESLTGGLVSAALTDVAGSSAVVRGGVVAYATEAKAAVLGVPADLLGRHGPVSEPVAGAMAEAASRLFGTTFGVATTGVAGPQDQDGHPVGEVWVAVAGPAEVRVRRLDLAGDRARIRTCAVDAALGLLAEVAGAGAASRSGESAG